MVPRHLRFSLPDTGKATHDELLHRCERQRTAHERQISQGMEERCAELARHGEATDFTESLDYYTTCRVKAAFLTMNLQGLLDRTRKVADTIQRLRCILLGSAPALTTAYRPPPDQEQHGEADEGGPGGGGVVLPSVETDPNALCPPQPHDYDLLDVDDDAIIDPGR